MGLFGFSDDGQGVPSGEVEQRFFGERARSTYWGCYDVGCKNCSGARFSWRLEVHSEIGEGTTVTMRIPLRKQLEVGLEAKRATSSEVRS